VRSVYTKARNECEAKILGGNLLIFQIFVWDPKIVVWDPQGVPGPQVKNHWISCISCLDAVYALFKRRFHVRCALRYVWRVKLLAGTNRDLSGLVATRHATNRIAQRIRNFTLASVSEYVCYDIDV